MKYIGMTLGTGLLAAVSLCGNAANENSKPNIIFILCDDMGYGDLGCYGQKYIQTPNIDRMAAEGMLFTQAYAGSPVSAPSRASLMTGQHTGHTHVRGNKEYWKGVPTVKYGINDEFTVVGQEPYDANHIILPEIMKRTVIQREYSANGQVAMKALVPRRIIGGLMNSMAIYASFKLIYITLTF